MFQYDNAYYSVFYNIYLECIYRNKKSSIFAIPMNEWFCGQDYYYDDLRRELEDNYGFSYTNEYEEDDDDYIHALFIDNIINFEDYLRDYYTYSLIKSLTYKFNINGLGKKNFN